MRSRTCVEILDSSHKQHKIQISARKRNNLDRNLTATSVADYLCAYYTCILLIDVWYSEDAQKIFKIINCDSTNEQHGQTLGWINRYIGVHHRTGAQCRHHIYNAVFGRSFAERDKTLLYPGDDMFLDIINMTVCMHQQIVTWEQL